MNRLPPLLLALLSCAVEAPSNSMTGESPDGGSVAADGGERCVPEALALQAGTTRFVFERLQFGRTGAAASSSGREELYFEAHRGGEAGCPSESSPSPATTLVISGLPADSAGTVRESDGLKVALFDFSGELGDVLLRRATSATAQVDVDCGAADAGPVLRLEASFEGLTLGGGAIAAHCDSLDEL
jgi:hypothetical protein